MTQLLDSIICQLLNDAITQANNRNRFNLPKNPLLNYAITQSLDFLNTQLLDFSMTQFQLLNYGYMIVVKK